MTDPIGSKALRSAPPTCPVMPVTTARIAVTSHRPAASARLQVTVPRRCAPTTKGRDCPNPCRSPDRSSAQRFRRLGCNIRRTCRRSPPISKGRESHAQTRAAPTSDADSRHPVSMAQMFGERLGLLQRNVHHDVEHFAAQDANELTRAPRVLKVKAAQHPLRRAREVVLHEWTGDAVRCVSLFLVDFAKIAAPVGYEP